MGLFNKNPNEVMFAGGKKHCIDVIKNSGPGELLLWRQPEEDFNTNSVLTVMPGEQAIFIKNGQIQQVFDNGRYQLSTENYPFISRLRNAISGGISTFNCVVYFIRKADSEEIKWGTDSPILVRDKVWNIRTDARVRGIYKVRIESPEKFLAKLVGNNVAIQFQEDLNRYFAGELSGKIKAAVSRFLNSLQQELIGIDAYLDELSDSIIPYIDSALSDYGLKCVTFALVGLDIDTTKYDAIDSYQINDVIGEGFKAQGSKNAVNILGDDWGRVKGIEVLKDLANNPGAGGVAAAGAGAGMGMGAANAFATIAQQTFAPVTNTSPQQPPYGQPFGNQPQQSRFTQKSAAPVQEHPQQNTSNNSEDPFAALEKLNKLLTAGFITQDDYDKKKAEILSRL